MHLAPRLTSNVVMEMKRDHLNPNNFFSKKAYGKVVYYEEPTYFKVTTQKLNIALLKKIKSLVGEYVQRIEELERKSVLYSYEYQIALCIEEIINNKEVDKAIQNYVIEQGMSFFQAYELGYKSGYSKVRKNGSSSMSKSSWDKVTYLFDLIMKRLKSIIHYVYLEQIDNKINEDFILVIDKFIPEIFFNPSERLKGIIYRKKDADQVKFNYFAMQYQIPILKASDLARDLNYALIDLSKGKVFNPSAEQVNQFYVDQALLNDCCYIANPFHGKRFKIHAMIANYKDVDLIEYRPLFETTILYNTDVVVSAHGMALTKDQWLERFQYIFKKFKGSEIFIRIPSFKKDTTPDEIKHMDPFDLIMEHTEYLEDFMEAIAHISNLYPEKTIQILVPCLGSKTEFDEWEFHLKCMMERILKQDNVRIIYEYNAFSAMHDMEEDMGQYDFVINLDMLCSSYQKDLLITKDTINLQAIRSLNIYDDLQHTRYILKCKKYRKRELLMGHVLQEESIFHRLIITGYDEYIIPAHTTNHVYDILEYYFDRRGKFVGVYHKDLIRTQFYRDKRKKGEKVNDRNDSDYKKYLEEKRKLEEKVKKLKESKQKKDSEESENENQ